MAVTVEANIADLKNRLSEYLERVEQGEEIVVCKRNKPIARISPIAARPNQSKPGWAKGTIKVRGAVTGPIMEDDWQMLK